MGPKGFDAISKCAQWWTMQHRCPPPPRQRLGQGGRGRSKGGEKPMGTTAYGGKGSKGRAANGDRPVGAASCRRDHHTMASCQNPPRRGRLRHYAIPPNFAVTEMTECEVLPAPAWWSWVGLFRRDTSNPWKAMQQHICSICSNLRFCDTQQQVWDLLYEISVK